MARRIPPVRGVRLRCRERVPLDPVRSPERRRPPRGARFLAAAAGIVALAVLSFAGIEELQDRVDAATPDRAVTASSTPSDAITPVPPSPTHHAGARADRVRSVYANDGKGQFSPNVKGIPSLVYVPNTVDGTVDEIDPKTFRVVRELTVGGQPHHVTPSWNLRHLYVDNAGSDLLQVIDPRTGNLGRSIPVASPYNLYFTPDGSKAIVVAEYESLMEFRDPHTWRLLKQVSIPWPGVDHLDFSRTGRYLLVSCEYSGMVVRVDTRRMKVTGTVAVGGRPIDIKVSPNGKVFFVANQGLGGVSVVDPVGMRQVNFIPTGTGAHGFAVSRNGKLLYVSNRLEGSISVISFATRKVVATWSVGGSPDMLQVSPNGTQLWASNRFSDTVSVVSTKTGRLITTITVGRGPHGLTFFPEPGRHSIGHNGVYR